MNNEEAIKWLGNLINDIGQTRGMYLWHYAQALQEIISMLANCEAAQQWISVKDRLPTESDGTVLICYPNEAPYNLMEPHPNAKHDQRVATGCYSQYSSAWYHGDMMGVGGADPIAWMPLPEPPKEEKQK